MQVGAAMELLRPQLADITADGLSLVGEAKAEDLGLSEDDAVVLGPLAVSLDLTNVEGLVAVTGVLEGTIVRECVRCLKEYEDPLAFSVRAAFIPEPKSTPRHPKRVDSRKAYVKVVEAEQEEEPDDQYQYQGNQLELAPMLREHVILSAPMQPLCGDDCLGLCAQCGKNLNEGLCQCAAELPFPTFRVVQVTNRKTGGSSAS
ncbi:MAG: YceD family protein [Nitrospiraceae bacterium]